MILPKMLKLITQNLSGLHHPVSHILVECPRLKADLEL